MTSLPRIDDLGAVRREISRRPQRCRHYRMSPLSRGRSEDVRDLPLMNVAVVVIDLAPRMSIRAGPTSGLSPFPTISLRLYSERRSPSPPSKTYNREGSCTRSRQRCCRIPAHRQQEDAASCKSGKFQPTSPPGHQHGRGVSGQQPRTFRFELDGDTAAFDDRTMISMIRNY
jgi:hypothetical protein